MAEIAGSGSIASPGAGAIGAAPRWWTGVRGRPVALRFILVLLVLYLAKQAIYVVAFPPFTGHDEVAHYAYLRTVATEGRVPVLLEDRLPDDLYRYCAYTLNWQPCYPGNRAALAAPPRQDLLLRVGAGVVRQQQGMQYAANHPPLYYILMTPIYWVTEQGSPAFQQYMLRVAAIPFGIATVLLAYLLARALFPGDRFLALTVPTFVALQPQISYEAAMVNNDIVSIAFYSWVLYLLVIGLRDRFPTKTCLLLGFALGLALLAKGTSLTAVPIVGVTVVAGTGWKDVRGWSSRGLLIAAPFALLVAPWYAFLYRTYGNLTGFDQIVELQKWNLPQGGFMDQLFDREFAVMRFKETWGEFGWRRIPLASGMLWAIGLPLAAALSGLVPYAYMALRRRVPQEEDPVLAPVRWQAIALLMLLGTCLMAYLAVVQFGTRFVLTQARYYFPAINAVALLLLLGLRTLIPVRHHNYGQTAVFAALVLLNVLIFTQYVLPYYPRW